MKIAIPVVEGMLSAHFGHCESFALFEVESKEIRSRVDLTPPPHEPGVLPKWLGEQGAELIIAGGMGQRAVQLFTNNGVAVIVGAPSAEPEKIIRDYLDENLATENNLCDH